MPLYFLCGPFISKGDKREIFSNYLINTYKKKENTIKPFPIIVDEIFVPALIKKYKLEMSLLEEIVAAISYRTFIFLDSLSTAYELGSFKNGKNKNNVTVLAEEIYDERKLRRIGTYLEEAIGSETIIKYPYSYKNPGDKEKEFFHFADNQVPDTLKDFISKEIDDYKINPSSINITDEENEDEDIVFAKINNHTIDVSFSLKSLFYFMGVFLNEKFSSYKRIKHLSSARYNGLVNSFKAFTKKQVLKYLGTSLNKMSYYENVNIGVKSYPFSMASTILRHIYYFYVLNTERKNARLHKIIRQELRDARWTRYDVDLLEMSGSLNDKITKGVKRYLSNPEPYIDKLSYVINKRERRITTYKNNYKGQQLRFYHSFLLKILDLTLPSNDNSFAYKKDRNTLMCVERHIKSKQFLKVDIHKYFESIKYGSFFKMFLKQIAYNLKQNGFPLYRFKNESELKRLIKSAFYDYHLPIGFISSPKISDFYLKSIDDWASELSFITYTRYADDILVSSKSTTLLLDTTKTYLEELLSQKDLTINSKKTITKKFVAKGDYVKFLGIVLMKKGKENIIKISKSYINKTVKECYKVKNGDVDNDEQIMGKIRYIKNISNKSYESLLKALKCNTFGTSIAERIEKEIN